MGCLLSLNAILERHTACSGNLLHWCEEVSLGVREFLRRRGWVAAAVVALLGVYGWQVLHAIGGESLTWDEGDHIFSGVEIWRGFDYGLNPEHPPMVKMTGALPLLGLGLKVPELQGRFFKTEAYMDGRELLYRNGAGNGGRYEAGTLIWRARVACGVFGLAAALLVFAAGTEMFGAEAGLCALLLFCFEPNILAHSAYVTTDMAASCTMFGAVYAFWRWATSWTTGRPTALHLIVTGLAGGLALAAKHSTVLLLPMLVVLTAWLLRERWRSARAADKPFHAAMSVAQMAGSLAVVLVISVAVLWAFYGFRYAGRPAGLALSPTLAEYVKPLAAHEAAGILLVARLRLLPESWLYGLADVRAMANGMPSYFFGKVYEHGVWFYFPVLFTIKSTLGMLALLALTAFAGARGWLRGRDSLVFLTVPPAIYLLVAMDSHLNIGARHILPMWVFCCVLCGAGASALARRGRGWAWMVGVLLLTHVGSSVKAAPNYIAYANEAWGGPTQTYRYLSDSNTDWGQQLVATSAYLRERGVKQCWIAYFVAPFVLPEDYGIPCKQLPTPDTYFNDVQIDVPAAIEGPVLISAGTLNGFELGDSVLNPYESFRSVKPTAYVQDGMFVFDGQFRVPLASALAYTQRSAAALKKGDIAEALRNAAQGEEIAPGAAQTELALGDAKAASGQRADALAAYERARMTIATMEPEGREVWGKVLEEKVRNVR